MGTFFFSLGLRGCASHAGILRTHLWWHAYNAHYTLKNETIITQPKGRHITKAPTSSSPSWTQSHWTQRALSHRRHYWHPKQCVLSYVTHIWDSSFLKLNSMILVEITSHNTRIYTPACLVCHAGRLARSSTWSVKYASKSTFFINLGNKAGVRKLRE